MLNLKWTKALIKECSLVVDVLIIYDLVEVVVIKLPDKLKVKMKMMITILEEWLYDYKSN